MTYLEWFESHSKRHTTLVATLSHLNDRELIQYFDYDNISQKHPDFCPLFAQGVKCHDMERLNCYLCACPYFRFDDESKWVDGGRVVSYCSINAKDSATFEYNDTIHNDCSHCLIPHRIGFIRKQFSRNFKEIMCDCNLNTSSEL